MINFQCSSDVRRAWRLLPRINAVLLQFDEVMAIVAPKTAPANVDGVSPPQYTVVFLDVQLSGIRAEVLRISDEWLSINFNYNFKVRMTL